MNTSTTSSWQTIAILVARLVFAAVFTMATVFKFLDINATAAYIASAGFPLSLLLAWVAAFFELALVVCFLTGAYFTGAAMLAGVGVVLLAFAFDAPSNCQGNRIECGALIDHFVFMPGLLYAAVYGAGLVLAWARTIIGR